MSQRSLGTWLVLAAALVCGAFLLIGLEEAAKQQNLPLADAGIIREQAAEKRLDPALIAAVIYCESKFEPRESAAGAQGLMQILPATAYYLAQLSGGRTFTSGDLATPRVNVAYGSYYLRYLLDHYGGNEVLALAAYNGGLANVDRWAAQAGAAGRQLTIAQIPFPETREYVRRVLSFQQQYRSRYAQALGIA
jgi:soluble lytic murein transglycosylase